jgi:hypothetical protein
MCLPSFGTLMFDFLRRSRHVLSRDSSVPEPSRQGLSRYFHTNSGMCSFILPANLRSLYTTDCLTASQVPS